MAKPTITPPPVDLPQRGQPYETTFVPRVTGLLAYHPVLDGNLSGATAYLRDENEEIRLDYLRGKEAADNASQSLLDAKQQVVLASNESGRAENEADRAAIAAVDAESSIGYQGEWQDAAGAGVAGQTYGYDGSAWVLIQDVPDIIAVPPESGEYWVRTTYSTVAEIEIGQPIFSFAPLDTIRPGMYVESGKVYLQSEYPELFEVIGIGSGTPPFDPLTEFYVPPVNERGIAVSGDWQNTNLATAYIVARIISE